MKYCLALLLSLNILFVRAQNEENPVHITHYEINLSVLDFAGHRIEGHTRLFAVPQVAGLNNLQLDLEGLTVDSVKMNEATVPNFVQNSTQLIIPLTPVSQGDTLLVQVYYQGTPVHDPGGFGGFYFSGNVAYNMGVGMTAVPHSYGRVWFPCIDSFTDKATYQFNIRTAADKKAVCGGLLTDSTLQADNTIVWHWQLTDPIPTYLASVAVSNYQLYRDTLHGLEHIIPVEIYATPTNISAIPATFATLKAIAHHYEWCFGPYQWQKIGYVIVPFNGGAMEHATNISYPQFAVNGTLTYETLFAHELSHSWFGNLVTCTTAQDMWINEGFARYSELLAVEMLYATNNPETDGYRKAARALMRDVLLHAHTSDGGYYAINQVPDDITYGATTYDKGGVVAHALRYYLGDSLFFQGMKALMQQYKFQNIGSAELFNFLSQQTGVNLNDFYEAYVNQPGFLHFSIDSIRPTAIHNQYKVAVRQKLSHALQLGNNQLIDLSFFDAAGRHYTVERCSVSGSSTLLTLTLPFEPLFGVVDYNERLCDAVIDYNLNLVGTGTKNLSDAAFSIQVTQLGGDSAWLHVERHLVAPDPLPMPHPDIYLLSDAHYWSVEYIAPPAFDAVWQFRYNAVNANYLDYNLLHQNYPIENLVLLYRRDASHAWGIAPYTRTGSQYSGLLKPAHLAAGEYALAMGNPAAAAIPETLSDDIRCYPNPATNQITIELPKTHCYKQITLYNSAGKVCLKKDIDGANITLSLDSIPVGIYMATLTATDGNHTTIKIEKSK